MQEINIHFAMYVNTSSLVFLQVSRRGPAIVLIALSKSVTDWRACSYRAVHPA